MPESGENDARTLKALRDRIDDIDARMHGLLIERGSVIEALIHTKGTGRAGAAFRPMREAAMMRALVARHSGALPLATIEHIWREIITTFTHMQAAFSVVFDASVEPDRMRDLARFVFGFSVELTGLPDAAAVVARVAEKGDLGLIARKAPGAWWQALARPRAPRIMALLPFIVAERSPADLPAFVLSPPLMDETPADLTVLAASVSGPLRHVDGIEVLATAAGEDGTEALLAAPADVKVAESLKQAGVTVTGLVPVGGFARGIAAGGSSTGLYRAAALAGEQT